MLLNKQEPSSLDSKYCASIFNMGGVLKFGFGREVPLWNLKVDPYKCQFVKKKQPIHIPICPILGQILSKIDWFFQNFSKNFGSNLEKILKTLPIYIPNSAFYKGSFIYQEADFATHVGGMSLWGLLYWGPQPNLVQYAPSTVSNLFNFYILKEKENVVCIVTHVFH